LEIGAQGIAGFETTSTTELTRVLKKVLDDGERILDEIAKELSDKDMLYCRLKLSVLRIGKGLETSEVTQKYLEKYDSEFGKGQGNPRCRPLLFLSFENLSSFNQKYETEARRKVSQKDESACPRMKLPFAVFPCSYC